MLIFCCRIYTVNPTTKLYTEAVLAGEQTPISGTILYPYGKDHIPFLDACEDAGLKVIYPLFGDPYYMKNTPTDQFERFLNNMVFVTLLFFLYCMCLYTQAK